MNQRSTSDSEQVTYEFVEACDMESCVRQALDWLTRAARQDGVTTSVVSSDEIGECGRRSGDC